MKICLPTKGKGGLKEQVFNHFGSATCFTIYDTETEELKTIENDNQHHAHGACQPLNAIAGYGVDVVLTSGMGKRAVNLLNQGGVKVYLLEGETVEEALKKFAAGQLQELTLEGACGGHGCH